MSNVNVAHGSTSAAFAEAFQAYVRSNHLVFEPKLERARFLAQQWFLNHNLDRLQQADTDIFTFFGSGFGGDMVHDLRIRQCFSIQWDDDELERMADAFDWWFDAAMRHYQRAAQWIMPLIQEGQGRPYGAFYGMMPAEDDADDLLCI